MLYITQVLALAHHHNNVNSPLLRAAMFICWSTSLRLARCHHQQTNPL